MANLSEKQLSRKDSLLKIIVEEYVKSAFPVGSGLVAKKYLKDLSSATIRNDMAELEGQGLICHPHTSAGRIPTLKGYQYYLDNFIKEGKISSKNKAVLDKLAGELKSDRESVKSLAKTLAEISSEAVLIGFSPHDIYYTGIANLFRQPEFFQHRLVYSMSEIIDHLDEVIAQVFDRIEDKVEVLIGEDNPFGNMSSTVLIKYDLVGIKGLIGILGPNRMDYQENMGLIQYSQELFKKLN